MNRAYLLIGGNIGNREQYLQQARLLIQSMAGDIVETSSIYETAAWGIQDQSPFLNQVLHIKTHLSPHNLLEHLLTIEEKLGRKRMVKYGPRIIDLDILLFNDEVINEENLSIPHPALPDRRFALIPLNEIDSDVRHPVLNKTITELLNDCKDTLEVTKYSD